MSASSLKGAGAPRTRGAPVPEVARLADERHLAGLRALRTLLDLVLDGRAFIKALVALALDRAERHEDVVTTLGLGDEAVALVSVEPLDGSGCHIHTSSSAHERQRRGARPRPVLALR